MITRKKDNYETTTKTAHLESVASGESGGMAAATFGSGENVYSGEYIIPFHAVCSQKVKRTQETETLDDDTCQDGSAPPTAPVINGANNITINQGVGIDLRAGVTAFDMSGNPISFTVSPETIDRCDVGEHDVTYTATAEGETTTVIRKVTIRQNAAPNIRGLTNLTVEVNTDFDPMDGVSAVDANGNPVIVELVGNIYTLTKTVDGTDNTANYIEGTVVPLYDIPLDDRKRFDGWYDYAAMTGTPITSVTMDANKQVWAKITDLAAYASYDSSNNTFRIFVDEAGKWTNGQVVGTTTYYADWESTLNALPWTSESWLADVTTASIDNVIHPTRMQSLFNGMSALTTITGLWRIDTSNVAAFTNTFSGTSSLKKPIDLSTWDNTNGGSGVNCSNMFSGSGVTSINLCGWDPNTIVNMSGMFRQCRELTTIYASAGFDLSHLADPFTGAAFTGDTNLVGGQGTPYDSNYVRAQYARIDGGISAPGYFTER